LEAIRAAKNGIRRNRPRANKTARRTAWPKRPAAQKEKSRVFGRMFSRSSFGRR
jgi:hypothetical protein